MLLDYKNNRLGKYDLFGFPHGYYLLITPIPPSSLFFQSGNDFPAKLTHNSVVHSLTYYFYSVSNPRITLCLSYAGETKGATG